MTAVLGHTDEFSEEGAVLQLIIVDGSGVNGREEFEN
jgi:hypothetical protein